MHWKSTDQRICIILNDITYLATAVHFKYLHLAMGIAVMSFYLRTLQKIFIIFIKYFLFKTKKNFDASIGVLMI